MIKKYLIIIPTKMLPGHGLAKPWPFALPGVTYFGKSADLSWTSSVLDFVVPILLPANPASLASLASPANPANPQASRTRIFEPPNGILRRRLFFQKDNKRRELWKVKSLPTCPMGFARPTKERVFPRKSAKWKGRKRNRITKSGKSKMQIK